LGVVLKWKTDSFNPEVLNDFLQREGTSSAKGQNFPSGLRAMMHLVASIVASDVFVFCIQ
jgi:hypothetical protein